METNSWHDQTKTIEQRRLLASFSPPGSARIHNSPTGEVFLRDRGVAKAQIKLLFSIPLALIGAGLILQELWFYGRSPSVNFIAGGCVLLALSVVLAFFVVRSVARYKDLVYDPNSEGPKYFIRTGSWWQRAETKRTCCDTLVYRIHKLRMSSINTLGADMSWNGYAALIYCGDEYLTVTMKRTSREIDDCVRNLPMPFRSRNWNRGAFIMFRMLPGSVQEG